MFDTPSFTSPGISSKPYNSNDKHRKKVVSSPYEQEHQSKRDSKSKVHQTGPDFTGDPEIDEVIKKSWEEEQARKAKQKIKEESNEHVEKVSRPSHRHRDFKVKDEEAPAQDRTRRRQVPTTSSKPEIEDPLKQTKYSSEVNKKISFPYQDEALSPKEPKLSQEKYIRKPVPSPFFDENDDPEIRLAIQMSLEDEIPKPPEKSKVPTTIHRSSRNRRNSSKEAVGKEENLRSKSPTNSKEVPTSVPSYSRPTQKYFPSSPTKNEPAYPVPPKPSHVNFGENQETDPISYVPFSETEMKQKSVQSPEPQASKHNDVRKNVEPPKSKGGYPGERFYETKMKNKPETNYVEPSERPAIFSKNVPSYKRNIADFLEKNRYLYDDFSDSDDFFPERAYHPSFRNKDYSSKRKPDIFRKGSLDFEDVDSFDYSGFRPVPESKSSPINKLISEQEKEYNEALIEDKKKEEEKKEKDFIEDIYKKIEVLEKESKVDSLKKLIDSLPPEPKNGIKIAVNINGKRSMHVFNLTDSGMLAYIWVAKLHFDNEEKLYPEDFTLTIPLCGAIEKNKTFAGQNLTGSLLLQIVLN